jgi:hypothetical protein
LTLLGRVSGMNRLLFSGRRRAAWRADPPT